MRLSVPKPSSLDPTVVRKLKSLAWLSPDKRDRLATLMSTVKIRRREVIFYERQLSDQVYFLLAGVAKLSFLNREGERVLVSLLGPGEIFGITSLLPQAPRQFRADAFSDCLIGIVKPEQFVTSALGADFTEFSRTMEATVGRWWAMLLRYVNFFGLNLRERLAAVLLELSSKFGVRDARGIILTLTLTHEDLAELVGASRQRVTEQLIEFERQKIIIREGRRLVLIEEGLSKVIQTRISGNHRRGAL